MKAISLSAPFFDQIETLDGWVRSESKKATEGSILSNIGLSLTDIGIEVLTTGFFRL